MTKVSQLMRTAAAIAVLSAAAGAQAQNHALRADEIEAKRATALAGVLGPRSSARSRHEPQVLRPAAGSNSCEINVGDVRGAKDADAHKPLGQSFERRGLARTQYVTVVDAPVMCLTR